LILLSPSPSHPLSNQASFIFGHRSTDLEQELIVRILAHGPVDKLDLAPSLFKFLHQEHLMDVVASQAIRGSDHYSIEGAAANLVTQAIQSRAAQTRSTVAIVTKNVVLAPGPSLRLTVFRQELDLLLDGLCKSLTVGRHAHIHRNFHLFPPALWGFCNFLLVLLNSLGLAIGKLDPIAAGHRLSGSWNAERSMAVVSCVSS
jgi:hypothetical protein